MLRLALLCLLLAGCNPSPKHKPMTPAEMRAAVDECERYRLKAVPVRTLSSAETVRIICRPRDASDIHVKQ